MLKFFILWPTHLSFLLVLLILIAAMEIYHWILCLVSSLISWKTKKQTAISWSSSKVEHRVLTTLSCELQWFHYLLTTLNVPSAALILVFCNNQCAIYLTHNTTFNEQTKSIEIHCHVILEKIQSGFLHLMPVSSSTQMADMFSTALHPKAFTHCLQASTVRCSQYRLGGVLPNKYLLVLSNAYV